MPRYRPDPNDQPVSTGGEDWLVNTDQQQKLCHNTPDAAA